MPNVPSISGGINTHSIEAGKETISTRVGKVQDLILEYAYKVASTFRLCEVLEYFFPRLMDKAERQRLLRRLHDAAQRLVRKGILRKLGRGVYQLVKVVEKRVVDTRPTYMREQRQARKRCGLGPRAQGGVIRFHISIPCVGLDGGLVVLWERLRFVELFARWLRGRVEERLGLGRSRRRWLEGRVRRAFERVRRGAVRLGVHGLRVRGRRGRFVACWDGFVPLEEAYKIMQLGGRHVAEIGFDVYVSGLSREEAELLEEVAGFMKCYFKTLGASVVVRVAVASSA